MPLVVRDNIAEVKRRFALMGERIPAATKESLDRFAQQAEATLITALEDATPIGDRTGRDTSSEYTHLRETVRGLVEGSGDMRTISVTEDKQVQSERGGPWFLINLLSEGHDAPSEPIIPIHARALFWPGLDHPVASSPGGSYAGSPFLVQAELDAAPIIGEEARQAGNLFFTLSLPGLTGV